MKVSFSGEKILKGGNVRVEDDELYLFIILSHPFSFIFISY